MSCPCNPAEPTGWSARPNQFNVIQQADPNWNPPQWVYWFDDTGTPHACFPGLVAYAGLDSLSAPMQSLPFAAPPPAPEPIPQSLGAAKSEPAIELAWEPHNRRIEVRVDGERVGFIRVQRD
jgi:hypothetical protein